MICGKYFRRFIKFAKFAKVLLSRKLLHVHVHVVIRSIFSGLLQVWNHPWVLKLDEDRKFEREERKRQYDGDDGSLNGFIVSGSGEESVARKKA